MTTIINRHGSNSRLSTEQFVRRYENDVQPLYVHLRARGFSRFDSFVAAFGDDYAARQTEIEQVCETLESTKEWAKAIHGMFEHASSQELIALWDNHFSLSKVKTSIAVASLKERLDAHESRESERAKDQYRAAVAANLEADRREAVLEGQKRRAMASYGEEMEFVGTSTNIVDGEVVGRARVGGTSSEAEERRRVSAFKRQSDHSDGMFLTPEGAFHEVHDE